MPPWSSLLDIAGSDITARSASPEVGDGRIAVKPNRRRHIVIVAVCTGFLFLLLIAALWNIGVFGGNVRTIEPGRAYRSSTLTGFNYTAITARWVGNDLVSVLKRDHIHTVISLRGGSPADDWYRDEVTACKIANVDHKDIPFSARKLPPPKVVADLLDTFDHARYPILFHCQAGSDRTGLAAALYAHIYEKRPLAKAEAEELTWRYGHFPVDKTRAMDDFFALYRADPSGMDLRAWIINRYPAVYAAKTGGSTPK